MEIIVHVFHHLVSDEHNHDIAKRIRAVADRLQGTAAVPGVPPLPPTPTDGDSSANPK